MTQAPLSPGEVLVLLDPNLAQGRAALKVNLIWLLALGYLRTQATEEKGAFGRRKTVVRLRVANGAAAAPPALPAHAAAVLKVVSDAETAGENAISYTVRHMQRVFGLAFERFQRDLILPALLSHQLIEAHRQATFSVFTRQRFRHTPTGAAERRRLQGLIDRAAAIPDYLDRDPAQAVALAAALGSAILLVEPLRPHLNRLAQLMAAREGGGEVAFNAGGGDGSSGESTNERHPDLPLEFEPDFDLGALDAQVTQALAGDLSAFADSFDASGVSGGDGGGGGGAAEVISGAR